MRQDSRISQAESILKALVMNRELVPPVQASKLNKVIMAEALAETAFGNIHIYRKYQTPFIFN